VVICTGTHLRGKQFPKNFKIRAAYPLHKYHLYKFPDYQVSPISFFSEGGSAVSLTLQLFLYHSHTGYIKA
jgi:hypothetical protein